MYLRHICSLVAVALVLVVNVAEAQVIPEILRREISAEIAYFDESGNQYGNVIDATTFAETGEFNGSSEVNLDLASSFASQTTSLIIDGDALVISGDLSSGYLQPEAGINQFFRSWSLALAQFSIATESSYHFYGHLSGEATAEFFVLDMQTNEMDFVTLSPGDFDFTAQLSGPGSYRFDVSIFTIQASELSGGRQGTLEFTYEVNPGGSVATENTNWGNVKSLYR